ncbi:4-hydroxy-tetrahydrodipicolinate synthase [Evansella cellulosilytica]|uniref:4-hydroxy-tetrahydrodipicolinate synthase n=1 Tax=Evansella cellulosilytica (strain ATCC 21833 / DSM 2522 / FERM P-1141 / JCM 9156 / N-4) TaxID=649639 RepID=E6TQH8_EVAC2|nr:4-hydroxy-tetrahydrodipicolinate synthase [Evansella cellulosilytica]ADU30489.1 dihydrodipicolinate synthase [Evansella cellulosilytica DSM 2522]
MNFGTLITAMITPFDHDEEIDYPATKSLIHYLIDNGSDSIVIGGTTGESPTLTIEEKTDFFKYVVKEVDGRIPVIAGTGTNSTKSSIQLTKIAEESGVDAAMLVAPYYNKPSQEGIYRHFEKIAHSTSLPIMLYNIPGRCSVNIDPNTIIKLSNIDNIVAVKEASGDINAIAAIAEKTYDSFYVYCGDDSLTLPTLSVGGHGVVSVASHILGSEMKEMIDAHETGNALLAKQLHQELLPMMHALFIAPNPTPVKAALEMFGINAGSVRMPLVPLTQEESKVLYECLQHKLLSRAV